MFLFLAEFFLKLERILFWSRAYVFIINTTATVDKSGLSTSTSLDHDREANPFLFYIATVNQVSTPSIVS
jgi:hypothetical protein